MAHNASAATTAQKRKYTEEEETAGLCANGCGFFGAATTGNMCSKCYRDHVHVHAATADTAAAGSVCFIDLDPAGSTAPPPAKKARMTVAVPSSDGAAASSAPAVAVDPAVTPAKQPAVPANRCAACRKKVGLLGFRCRCEGTFCSVHRYSEKHDCGFDYKAAGQEQIAKHNPLVVADKMTGRI